MKILSAHQIQFIPWLGFFSKIKSCDHFVFLDDLKYSKLSFQSRNKVISNSVEKSLWLSIPVDKSTTKNLFSNVLIDNRQKNWKSKHLKTIYFSYLKSNYFDEIYTDIENLYKNDEDNLSKFIYKFIQYGLKIFQINTKIFFQSELIKHGLTQDKKKSELLLEITKFLNCECFLFGSNAKKYFFEEHEKIFIDQKINFLFQNFIHPIYPQYNSNKFLPNLSFLDLLFNCGKNESFKYLQISKSA